MDELEENGYDETKFIKKLQESSKDEMMDLIYHSIVNERMGALKHNAPIEDKIEGVQKILDFFKEREEYEKCIELKKIIDKLSC
jgi:hypothetical protein